MAAGFTCTRSAVIAGAPERILAEIADLRRHEAWSPFAKPDPKRTATFEGAPGAGQVHTFSGGRGGAGRLTIDSVEPRRVVMTLAMRAPLRATNRVEFTLDPQPNGVRIAWTMTGPQTLMGRIMGLFMDTDAMCGGMFEQGLADLKTLMESPARLAA